MLQRRFANYINPLMDPATGWHFYVRHTRYGDGAGSLRVSQYSGPARFSDGSPVDYRKVA